MSTENYEEVIEKLKNYISSLTPMWCKGGKCRIRGEYVYVWCESCYGEDDFDDDSYEYVECLGEKCRNKGFATYWCESCWGEPDDIDNIELILTEKLEIPEKEIDNITAQYYET